jgi:hypothetical protein
VYDPNHQAFYYVNTTTDPPITSWTHPSLHPSSTPQDTPLEQNPCEAAAYFDTHHVAQQEPMHVPPQGPVEQTQGPPNGTGKRSLGNMARGMGAAMLSGKMGKNNHHGVRPRRIQ